MGAAPDLNEPQKNKNVFLQIVIDQAFTFGRIFFSKIALNLSFDVRYEWSKWRRKRYPFTASSLQNYAFCDVIKLRNKGLPMVRSQTD